MSYLQMALKVIAEQPKKETKAVDLFPDKTAATVWSNPFPKGAPEARTESLRQVMMAIWEKASNHVAAEGLKVIVSTPEIRAAEFEVERIKVLVLSGKAKLADFQEAVNTWTRILRGEVKI